MSLSEVAVTINLISEPHPILCHGVSHHQTAKRRVAAVKISVAWRGVARGVNVVAAWRATNMAGRARDARLL